MKKTIFLTMIVIMVVISFLNILYNINKTRLEIKEWSYLTNHQKREKIFGDLYTISMLIEKNTTKKSKILLVAEERMPYYLTRYFLYPKRIYLTNAKDLDMTNKQNKYQYIFAYNTKIEISNYKQIASFFSRTGNYGKLYKTK